MLTMVNCFMNWIIPEMNFVVEGKNRPNALIMKIFLFH